ncbi:non-specific lipid transfer protein GPI-anchored 5-like [Rhodamnia argentea]|uniref:Non-specific lipid transfer protein GPI-anchored 5-like n=1 Tax=Rhodamnia argentea TaxID=178133 RepID=A0ABM3HPI0_9MYRT|nr:non-specific lipid transfer protein GPI-anchored 5-like [Rhodamnia argentea]
MKAPRSAMLVTALVAAAAALLWAGVEAQTSCGSALTSLSPCLSFITGNSSVPSSACCTQLASVVKSEPLCLCEVLNGSASSALGVNINQTQALKLPPACNVQTPPTSSCNALSPARSPAGSPTSTPGGRSSDGSNASLKWSLVLFTLFMASHEAVVLVQNSLDPI